MSSLLRDRSPSPSPPPRGRGRGCWSSSLLGVRGRGRGRSVPRGRGHGRGWSSPPLARHDRPIRLLGVRGRGRGLYVPRTCVDLSLAFAFGEGPLGLHRTPSTASAHVVSSPPVYYGPVEPVIPALQEGFLQARILGKSLPPWFPRRPQTPEEEWTPVEFVAEGAVHVDVSSLNRGLFKNDIFIPANLPAKKLNFLGRCFPFEEICHATDDFKERNKIFHYTCPVFVGIHAQLGQIAVCAVHKSDDDLEYYLDGIMRCVAREERDHPNLAAPIGYCSGEEEFYVVYDFQFKTNLANLLETDGGVKSLEINIALDVANGLKHITNRDSALSLPEVKSEIIWLREDDTAVICDFFGSAKADLPSLTRDFAKLMTQLIPSTGNNCTDEKLQKYHQLADLCSSAEPQNLPTFDAVVQELESIAGAL